MYYKTITSAMADTKGIEEPLDRDTADERVAQELAKMIVATAAEAAPAMYVTEEGLESFRPLPGQATLWLAQQMAKAIDLRGHEMASVIIVPSSDVAQVLALMAMARPLR